MEGAPYPICVCFIVCTVHHSLHFTVHCRPEAYMGPGRSGPSWTPITAQTTNFTHKLAKYTYCPTLHYSNIQLQLCVQLVFDYYISFSEYYHCGRDIHFFSSAYPFWSRWPIICPLDRECRSWTLNKASSQFYLCTQILLSEKYTMLPWQHVQLQEFKKVPTHPVPHIPQVYHVLYTKILLHDNYILLWQFDCGVECSVLSNSEMNVIFLLWWWCAIHSFSKNNAYLEKMLEYPWKHQHTP